MDLRKICGGEGRYTDAEVGVWERDGGLTIIVNEIMISSYEVKENVMACEENKFAVRALQHLKPLKKLRGLASFILQKTCRKRNLGWRNPTNILSWNWNKSGSGGYVNGQAFKM